MSDENLYLRFLVALGIGLAAGIERGWKQRDEPSGRREAGVRTFSILSLIGFGAGVGAAPLGPMFPAAVALGVFALVAIIYFVDASEPDADHGATTEAAALLTFVLGALAGAGEVVAAGIGGAALVMLLDLKEKLHALLGKIHDFELTAGIKLMLVSVVLLPILPNEGYGPGAVLNPYQLWWAVVVIAAIGFAGYVAIRVAGPGRGGLVMGFMGGLVSSTSLTVSAARASKASPHLSRPLAGALAAAQSVMFVRTGVVVATLNPALLRPAALPLVLGALGAVVSALWLARRTPDTAEGQALHPGSPDMLSAAVKFVAVVACALIAAHYANLYVGDAGIILAGILSGAIDVDAASVSATRLAGGEPSDATVFAAAASIAGALMSNSIVKGLIARLQGAAAFAREAAIVLGVSAIGVLVGVGIAYLLP
jgi:uncharacterized membrane protein (DUF4010 family)